MTHDPPELDDSAVWAHEDEPGDKIAAGGESGGGVRFRQVDIGVTVGRYRIVQELGAGGMATVWRARDLELRREVALKVLFPHLSRRREVVARFHREARAAAALDHGNIVRVFDTGGGEAEAGDDGGVVDPPYLVMELVEGRSLAHVVADTGPMLAEVVACVGTLLADALAQAHRAGIVHRDIKPANVMVSTKGRLALTDFGVARIEGDDASLVTRTGMLLGTPAFMSPEQAMGDPIDERSDIYSLGATLYQLGTGSQPYSGSTARVMSAIAEHRLVPPLQRHPALGTEMARLIESLMARAPDDRPQTAGDAAEALRAVARHAGLDADPTACARELARFFDDPPGYTAAMTPVVVQASLRRAREAANRRALPQAMALADRALALDEGCDEALTLVRRLGAGEARRRWLVGAGLALATAGVVGTVIALWTPGSSVSGELGPNDAGPTDAAAAVDTAGPSDMASALYGADSGAGPVAAAPADAAVAARAAAEPRRTEPEPRARRRPQRDQEPAQAAAPEPAATPPEPAASTPDAGTPPPTTTAPAEPAPAASITVDIRPWCDLSIDGVNHGRADRNRVISLAPGRHSLVCSQGPGRAAWLETISLAPGQRLDLRGSVLQPVRVRVQVGGGDQVRIGDEVHPNGAEIELTPGRYRIAVLADGRQVGRAWVSIPAVRSCTVRDRPALDCYR
ncbi:protein kinase domain-containing protein [Haliangium sp.]|uniref:serine/threonine-protein kinase n=1 Tax=Haliangium sp. TaxID=2663208 RepID=UPI003D0E68CA